MPTNVRCLHPSSHGTYRGDSPIPASIWLASQVWWSPQQRQFCSPNQVCSRVVVAQTLCPSRNPRGSSHKGLKKDCLTRSTLSSDTRGRPARFPLQKHPVVWNCWYQRLLLLGEGGITVKLSPECPLHRNNWFMLRKLQHTKRFLLQSRHYRFATSQTEREEGSGIAHAHKTWTPAVSFHVGNLPMRAF